MKIKRVVPNILTDRHEESRQFHTTLFEFQVAMDMNWIVTLGSPDYPTARISLVRGETGSRASVGMTFTVEVGDVDAVHAEASTRGYQIVYPLTDEPWGVRRFHVRDPNGVVINVMNHVE